MKKYVRVAQRHHVSYDPEVTVIIYRSEHEVITKLVRLLKSRPSEDFLVILGKMGEIFREKWNREQEDSQRRPLTQKQMEDLYSAQQEASKRRRRERRQQKKLESKT